jgi:hypothetical protein
MQLLAAAFNSHWEPLVWFGLGVLGAVGLVALLHPRRATMLTMRDPGWVESDEVGPGTNEPASGSFLSQTVSRVFGVTLLGAVVAIAYFVAQR